MIDTTSRYPFLFWMSSDFSISDFMLSLNIGKNFVNRLLFVFFKYFVVISKLQFFPVFSFEAMFFFNFSYSCFSCFSPPNSETALCKLVYWEVNFVNFLK